MRKKDKEREKRRGGLDERARIERDREGACGDQSRVERKFHRSLRGWAG
jgi:hypothetical protein